MKNLLIITLLLSLSSCNKTEEKKDNKNKKENIELETISEDESLTSEYIPHVDNKFDFNDKKLYENLKKAIYKGDTLAYKSAYKQYIINGRSKEFLYYAIIMAEKNNYAGAYKDISTILDFEVGDPLVTEYKFSSIYGTYSLLKAYEMGNAGGKASVEYVYTQKGKPIPKSSSIYCKD
ncbi:MULTISPECIES: hypothetical protein [Chryseobacterium]|uniref:Uncharacterized protein n=1 Tax=Chryseobacterium geocarposphaerae TaxID=1416776 RepID=A0ABU1LGP5_9FLAO|nr:MULTISPECIES: hypothetical protein [Chryseobacterium]MDR6405879.1 hypothetical protein [Chryseobacterium geocarposphaerae]MDR6698957.1 hypothetical protein [Chryseobacterium ginsenosidimutans]